MIAVAHADLPAELHLRHGAGEREVLMQTYLPRLRAAGVGLVVGAVFVHPIFLPEMALSSALGQVEAMLEEVEGSGGAFALVTTAAELDRAVAADQIAVLLSLEGAEPLGSAPELLSIFYRLGVRVLGLTWNGRNAFADGCAETGGLTAAGRALVARARELGMAVDVSHLSDQSLADVLALDHGPVLASHSNCRALCNHPRNLTDGQLRELGRRGAVIGVNQVRFLCRRPDSPGTMEDLCAHLMRMETVAGPGSACLGLDFGRGLSEAVPRPRAYWETWDPSEEDVLGDWAGLPALAQSLAEHGLPPERVEGILGGNLLQFLRKNLPT